jgi:dTDP-4-amino-4,6-dideoxygalactose transaminase
LTGIHNFLPEQYDRDEVLGVNHNYLPEQFADKAEILEKISALVSRCDFTLGREVDEFEQSICELIGAKYAVGVGSGTDALFLSLKALGIGEGDEVITTPYTFYATIGAIVTAGARPVFVDIDSDFNLDPSKIENAITDRTKAILPVHWAGLPCDMERIGAIARKHNLRVVEDACHAILARRHDTFAGRFGDTGCFSLHPLKNLNVWGDGGYLVTDSDEIYERMVLLRNHGLVGRDECAMFAYNSRLDTLQAVVANHLLNKLPEITESRIEHATYFDKQLSAIEEITIPPRPDGVRQVYHLYVVRAQRRDELQQFLQSQGIDAKVHYPVPMHLQPAARDYGYVVGDFPLAEEVCRSVISLPVHEFITQKQQEFVVSKIRAFYAG